jgi:hypothetical protein
MFAHSRPPLNFKLSVFPSGRDATPSGPSRENRDPEHQPPDERNRAPRRKGEHRHFDACPRRPLQHHRRILAFVPTNSPNRDIQARRKHNIVLEGAGSEEGCNKRLPPDREQYTNQPQGAPASLAITRASQGEAPGALLAVEAPLQSTLANRSIRPRH